MRQCGLNNEAIAKAIETALGVTARKAAEKFAWCYASSNLLGRSIGRSPGLSPFRVRSTQVAAR